jgi:hypothetical protein
MVLIVGLPLALISFFFLAADLSDDFLMFGTMAIVFLALAGVFIVSNGSLNAQWCTAPSVMTILSSIQFVALPFLMFVTGDDHVDPYYLKAMTLLLLGYAVFWAVCLLLKRPYRFEFVPEHGENVPRIHFAAIVLFMVGLAANILMWKLGILAYGSEDVKRATGTSNVGVLTLVTRFLLIALLISAIEIFGKRSRSFAMYLVLGGSTFSSIAFGLVSGLKAAVLMPILVLALVLGITQRRLPKLVWVLPVAFVLLQVYVNAYRTNLLSGYGMQIDTLGGLSSTVAKSLGDAVSGNVVQSPHLHESPLQRFGSRLSELGLFHTVLQLPSPDLLNGTESIWLAPVYPLIPRPLWPDKPELNKGQRMSEALGFGTNNSVNIPGVADLYVLGGTVGILVGMMLWGVCLQLFMNNIGAGLTERGTFIYLSMLYVLTDIERDMVPLIGAAVEGAIATLVLSKIIYGGPLFSMRAFRVTRNG